MRSSNLSNIGRAKVPEIVLPLILASSKVKEDEVNDNRDRTMSCLLRSQEKIGNHRQLVNPSDLTCLAPHEVNVKRTWKEQLSSNIGREV